MLDWRKLGVAFPPGYQGELPAWLGGYAALPFAVPIGNRRARVLFSGRDERNHSRIGACTVDLDTLRVVPASVTQQPLVETGPAGAFDENGCSMSCVVRHRDAWYLYYTGWMLGRTVPFYLAIGLATSEDGESFRKISAAPLLERSVVDPFLCASPSVLIEDGLWRMWYVSAVRWEELPAGPRHHYLIKYAESDDGINWRRDGRVCIDFASPAEYAISRPHTLNVEGRYRMWYSSRGPSYRIGYAESSDGLVWDRLDDRAGIEPSPSGWDSEMQAYPMVMRDAGHWLMFYNGNGYGATGFGCAVGTL